MRREFVIKGKALFLSLFVVLLVGSTAHAQSQPWNKTFDKVAKRFQVLRDFNEEAVLDKETGLVWQKTLSTTKRDWHDAREFCYDAVIGDRKGWRLPTFEELTSLVDATTIFQALPEDHPFENVPFDVYWSMTTVTDTPAGAYVMSSSDGSLVVNAKVVPARVWCVRSGFGHDGGH